MSLRTHRKEDGCADPTCPGPAEVEVEWIVAPGHPLHYMGGQLLDPKRNKKHSDAQFGARQVTYLCSGHAAQRVAGDDPPISHRTITKPPRRPMPVETPRFADDFGL